MDVMTKITEFAASYIFDILNSDFPLNVMNLLFCRQGRLQYVSDNLLEILMDVIPALYIKSLGYSLASLTSAVDKYLNRPDSSFDCVSRSGCGEMLRYWRRTVRPSEQVDELHLALQNAGLGQAAEVFLPKRKYHITLSPHLLN